MKNHLKRKFSIATVLLLGLSFFLACTSPHAKAAYIPNSLRAVSAGYLYTNLSDKTLMSTGVPTEAYADAIDELQDQINTLSDTVDALGIENTNLKARITSLENKSQSTTIVTTSSQSVDLSDIEHRITVLERVVSMMEVNLGSSYAYIDQMIAPIMKMLNLQ